MKYFLLLLLPCRLLSQDITGLWSGSLYNDTTQQTLDYEVAISNSNGKYTAYSYTTFVIDGKEVNGLKSIKVVKQQDHFFLEDVELLFNNYPYAPPKGVKQISSVTLSEADETKKLSGKFITTRTKQYGKQLTGTLSLAYKKNLTDDKLIAALSKMGLAHTLAFAPANADSVSIAKNKTMPPSVKKERINQPIDPLKEVTRRKVETIETILFTSDSLKLILYDNGYVDGDSVSLILDGKLILQHKRLSTDAITKTIAATGDSLQLIMYAENLGSISPNTGLLIIMDGDKRHEVRFEGDLEKNAAVMLKRQRFKN